MELSDIKSDLDRLVSELVKLGCDVRDRSHIRCPLNIHADAHGSFSVFMDKEIARWKCHGCGNSGTIVDLLSIISRRPAEEICKELAGTNPPSAKPVPQKKPAYVYKDEEALRVAICKRAADTGYELAAFWTYYDVAENPVLITFRLNKIGDSTTKKFTQARKVEGGWINRNEGVCPIYRAPAVSKAETVIVCEGEKCADILVLIGYEATTSAMGAGKAGRSDWSCLKGKKVIVWPDNDEVGRKHGEDVREILCGLDCDVRMIDATTLMLPEGGDAYDLLQRVKADGMTKRSQVVDLVDAIIATATKVEPKAIVEFDGEMHEVKTGGRIVIDTPWPILDRETQAMMPRNIVLLAGSPGASKSFMALQLMRHAIKRCTVSALMLEDDRTFHMRRVLAQASGCAKVVENKWVEEHRDQYDKLREAHADELACMAQCINEVDRGGIDAKGLLLWLEKNAPVARVLVIDPISYMRRSKNGWLDDEEFLDGAHEIVKKHNTTLVLVTHPTKGGMGTGPVDMSLISGGTGYIRKPQTVLFISKLSLEKKYTIGVSAGRSVESINRCVWVFKARNAPGYHMLGYMFNGQSLSWRELGTIIKD